MTFVRFRRDCFTLKKDSTEEGSRSFFMCNKNFLLLFGLSALECGVGLWKSKQEVQQAILQGTQHIKDGGQSIALPRRRTTTAANQQPLLFFSSPLLEDRS
ncbi:hypothetical protein J6590_041904 [Homalodisca vitripennis]|nr:hypothetical protein J6590_041904 [Homalodisca vitripennis]